VAADKAGDAAATADRKPKYRPSYSYRKHPVATATAAGCSGRKVLKIVFAAKDFSRFSSLVAKLGREPDIELVPAPTGAAGLAALKGIDVVIVDEQLDDMSGIAFINQVVKVNPLVNTALVSALAADEFHEATEGLGVLMQLPPHPREKDAEALLATLAKIGALMRPGVHS
jgi:DNA-binding NarL/FixJ family response regulator